MKRCKSVLSILLALTMVFGLALTGSAAYLKKAEETVTTKGGAGRCDIMTGIVLESSNAIGVATLTPKQYNSAYYYQAIVSLYVGGELIGTNGSNASATYGASTGVQDKALLNGRSIIVIGQYRTGNGNALYAWDKAVTLTYN